MDFKLQLVRMQDLYAKLYNRYTELKTGKFRELDECLEDQERKFVECTRKADELIEYYRMEQTKMYDDINELLEELSALKSAKDDLQLHLEAEKEKNRMLSAEVELLRQSQQKGLNLIDGTGSRQNLNSAQKNLFDSLDQQNESTMRVTRSAKKRARTSMQTDSPSHGAPIVLGLGSLSDQPKDVPIAHTLPECCQSLSNNEGSPRCVFHNLVECFTGMKVSVVVQSEGRCIRVLHENSGYTFDLILFNKASQGEQLMYQASSLGTLSTVAAEWMREPIIFHMSMCPVFFERVSRVIKGV